MVDTRTTTTSAAPPPRFPHERWYYIDAARRHEVRAGFEAAGEDGAAYFVVHETALDEDGQPHLMHRQRYDSAWEGTLLHWELEAALAVSARYLRHEHGKAGWIPVRTPSGTPMPDLRPVVAALSTGGATFHHFHHAEAGEVVLVVVARDTPEGRRFAIARGRYLTREPERLAVQLEHANLPATLARAFLVREHLRLRHADYHKLTMPNEFRRVFAHGFEAELLTTYRNLLMKLAHPDEVATPVSPRERPVDSLYTDYAAMLADPRVTSLYARFLRPGEDKQLVEQGEAFIQQALRRLHAAAAADEQPLLVVLEAALLARSHLRHGEPVDPDTAGKVRRFTNFV